MAKEALKKELRAKTNDELEVRLRELKKEAMNLRFQQASGQLENVSAIRRNRRAVARVRTILREKAGLSEKKKAGVANKDKAGV